MVRFLAFWLLLFVAPLARAADSAPTAGAGYHLGPGDVVRIQVYGEDGLSGPATISADGQVFVPLIRWVPVEGLTPQEAAQRLTKRLADGYLVSPQVSVEVQEFKSQKVSVVGAVHKPGEYFLTGPTTLLEMLARAGNIDGDKSAREVRVRHSSGDTTVVNLDGLLSHGEGDLPLSAGDVVNVPEGQFVYIAGQVAKPGAIVFWEGLTVTQALTKAGGPSETAQLHGAYILRDGDKLPVNLKKILDGRDADIELEPGDQLFLRQSPI